ncbi:pyrimidine reductase family protein [Acrocarpospora catenulata]|uniref:pyrimidine reductase family protein n=1 Tax=Acrocarpospora catenulata TaxID=2836182 RepID=UPI001BDA1EA7|nr:pyrimidine reductase family protein [Acrocarpospora catenulata]
MRQIHPHEVADPDLVAAYAYPEAVWLRVNMVSSVDGGAWFKGVSAGLSGKGDRRIFAILRGMSDVILAGASTVRVEGYGPVEARESWRDLRAGRPPAPPIAVVTRRLDLDLGGPLFTAAEPYTRTIVFTTEQAPKERRDEAARHADVVVAGEDQVDLGRVVLELRARGLGRILCEGGPRLNAQLAAADLIDELCLTIGPQLIGGDAARILNGTATQRRLALAQVLQEDGYLFCRYVRESA